MTRAEFTVADARSYDHRSPTRWVAAHIMRYPVLPTVFLLTTVAMAATQSLAAVMVGRAFDVIIGGGDARAIGLAALWVVAAELGYGASDIVNSLAIRVLAQRVERDARDEIYLSLLGKSQSFHGRQRAGDLMARVTNDVQQVNLLVSPALGGLTESTLTLVVPLVTIALLRAELLLVPLIFLAAFSVALRRFNHNLRPVAGALRERFGKMNAGLAEAISGIEVVKGFAQEPAEERRFDGTAAAYRDSFVREGEVSARYLPLLVYGLAIGLALGHALTLFLAGRVTVGEVITFMALIGTLRFPTQFLLQLFPIIQQGVASAERILSLIRAESDLDENSAGYAAPLRGEVVFEGVSFGYSEAQPTNVRSSAVLHSISFAARAGETVAIVGQTGSGKTTLTRLVNRTFDAVAGRVLVDGVDVHDWSMDSLRSQIATIEQDIFLFSRSIADNIAFGARGPVSRGQIEQAAREAQAHEFILAMPDGYDTVVGERGVTLSGGQRQRIAIARAFLSDPRILILDDSTSAIDSATEDQIQRAMRRILSGRTTLLITHRLSQIRSADRILLIKNGRLIDQGGHEDLLARSAAYRQLFVRDEAAPSAMA
ncbi:ABC transporter ATP-binding protein [Chloroflexales bacterium ZM16-3]|nr:ABC transporter ATP-binding protein [Chloroflexales bacterium ZM16-3]